MCVRKFYDQAIAQDNGTDHAHSNDNLRSTKFDLSKSSFTSDSAVPSLMAYDPDVWIDRLAYDELMSDEFEPDPPVGAIDYFASTVSIIGKVTVDGISLLEPRETGYQQEPEESLSDVTATVYGPGETVIGENTLSRGVTPQIFGDVNNPEPKQDLIFGTVTVPEETSYIEVTAPAPNGGETQSSVINPYVAFLREALLAVPADHILSAEEGYTQSVTNRLETLNEHIQNDRFKPAMNVLRSIDNTVQQRIESGYDTAPSSIRSKGVIQDMIATRIEKLRTLANLSTGNGTGNGNHKGKKNNKKGSNGNRGNGDT